MLNSVDKKRRLVEAIFKLTSGCVVFMLCSLCVS